MSYVVTYKKKKTEMQNDFYQHRPLATIERL